MFAEIAIPAVIIHTVARPCLKKEQTQASHQELQEAILLALGFACIRQPGKEG
jgi:hypothetical protein